jgi:Kef-type K+ transport system membrane component KefB
VTEEIAPIPVLVLLVSGLIAGGILAKGVLRRIGVPALVGYLALGFLLRSVEEYQPFLGEGGYEVLRFLAQLGIIALLFRVGLDSHLGDLLKQLPGASLIWVSDVTVNATLGFVAARWVLGCDLIPSAVVATAMTATSVGIPVQVWERANGLRSANGQRFLDVAELDDISGVLVLALLFAVLPSLHGDSSGSAAGALGRAAGAFLIKLVGFAAICFVFSQYVEGRLNDYFQRLEPRPDRILMVVSVGFAIAAVAALLGFSAAIGGFFAGLAFSRDPRSVRMEASFKPFFELFAPFFFIDVGYSIAPASLTGAVGLGALLLTAAVLGKLLGIVPPAARAAGRAGALVLGVSMVPERKSRWW